MNRPDLQEMSVFGLACLCICTTVFRARLNVLTTNGSIEKKPNIGLHGLMAIKQNWHEEIIKQFYSTLYVNPSRTSLTWMTGINKKITVMNRFCEKVRLVPSMHNSKIGRHFTDAQDKELKSADNKQVNLLNQILKRPSFPRLEIKVRFTN